MVGLFSTLSQMLQASAWLAVGAAFVWGVLSVVLSPCHLAGMPLIIGHIVRKGDGTRSAGFMSFLFALGILVTLLIIGFVTYRLGRLFGDTGPAVSIIVGVFIIGFGLVLTGFLPLPELAVSPRFLAFFSGWYGEAFILGLIFGTVLGPCSFAFMAPLLGVTFYSSSSTPGLSLALFAMYALGHSAVIVLGGVMTGWVKSYLSWNEKNRTTELVKKICGILVILGGLYILNDTLNLL